MCRIQVWNQRGDPPGSSSIGRKYVYERIGFLTRKQKNLFNEIIRFEMMCTVRHLWPSRAWSVFNYYCNWSFLILRNGN